MHLLPLSLKRVADLAASAQHSRFGATQGVQLECRDDKTYTVCATDGKRLVVVDGECEPNDAYFPLPMLDAAPNSGKVAVVPVKEWKQAFDGAAKLVKGVKNRDVVRNNVAVSIGEKVTSFAASNGDNQIFSQAQNAEGRFPNWRTIMPTDSDYEYTVNVDPFLFAETLLTVAAIGTDDESKRVEIRLNKDNPVVIRSLNPNRPKTTGLVVPLIVTDKDKEQNGAGPRIRPNRQRFDRLLAALRKLQAKREASHEARPDHQ